MGPHSRKTRACYAHVTTGLVPSHRQRIVSGVSFLGTWFSKPGLYHLTASLCTIWYRSKYLQQCGCRKHSPEKMQGVCCKNRMAPFKDLLLKVGCIPKTCAGPTGLWFHRYAPFVFCSVLRSVLLQVQGGCFGMLHIATLWLPFHMLFLGAWNLLFFMQKAFEHNSASTEVDQKHSETYSNIGLLFFSTSEATESEGCSLCIDCSSFMMVAGSIQELLISQTIFFQQIAWSEEMPETRGANTPGTLGVWVWMFFCTTFQGVLQQVRCFLEIQWKVRSPLSH